MDGIHATNPDGVRNRSLIFIADYGRATNDTLIGFGAGTHVSPAGEFHDFTISGNHVLDVLGEGGGPDDTSWKGEDYGDGIMCWGAGVTITSNVMTCKDGSDAPNGIHVRVDGADAGTRAGRRSQAFISQAPTVTAAADQHPAITVIRGSSGLLAQV